MARTSLESLRRLVKDSGHELVWCGVESVKSVVVHTKTSETRYRHVIDVEDELSKVHIDSVVRNGEADVPMTTTSPTPPNTDFFAPLRKASVLGIGTGNSCEAGAAKRSAHVSGCVCGYDLEIDLSDEVRGAFPLPSAPILSCALWCSCGYKEVFTSMRGLSFECTQGLDSKGICTSALQAITEHSPLWLVGWNCYSFDNTCMRYFLGDDYDQNFRQVKLGAASTVDYGFILDLEGTYNVDPFVYMQRNPAYTYPDLSLQGVAKEVGARAKTGMPDLYGLGDPAEILKYNINDSAIAAEIWMLAGLDKEITSLAACSCAPLYDCVRYMTGAMAACEVSSEALRRGKLMDWSRTSREVRYEGGKVFEPVRGLHKDVVVVDYSSMYPTIMVDARVSAESVEVVDQPCKQYGEVWWDCDYTFVSLGCVTAKFPRSGSSVQRDVLLKNIEERRRARNVDVAYSKSLKIASNSAYGCMGYENSPMYSPVCSSSVTAIGRWCLGVARATMEDAGLKVIYGDTDSCLVVGTGATDMVFGSDVQAHALAGLQRLHSKLSETPFRSMSMALESFHPRVILLDKKKYCKMDLSGRVQFKGTSVARRDATGLCKQACMNVSDFIMNSVTSSAANELIANYICSVVQRAVARKMTPWEVSMVKKRDQKKCYVYTKADGSESSVPIDMAINTAPDYDMHRVLKQFRAEVLRLTGPCGLGSLETIIARSNVMF